MCVTVRWRRSEPCVRMLDLREEFAKDFILPALQAGAVYEARYTLGTASARPLIAKHLEFEISA